MQNDLQQPPQPLLTPNPPKNQRRRLNYQGKQILIDFCQNVTPYPTSEQKQALLQKIHAVPECDWYESKHVSNWFHNQQKNVDKDKERKPNESLKPQIRQTLFPSFRVRDFAKLEKLITEDPEPTKNTLFVWAAALSINFNELERWVVWYKDRRDRKLSPDESASAPVTQRKQVELHVVPNSSGVSAQAERPDVRNMGAPLQRSASHLPTPDPSASPTPPARPIPASVRRIRELAETVKSKPAAENSQSEERISETLEEFRTSFERHEERIEKFMARVSNGEFEKIGFKASYAKPVTEGKGTTT